MNDHEMIAERMAARRKRLALWEQRLSYWLQMWVGIVLLAFGSQLVLGVPGWMILACIAGTQSLFLIAHFVVGHVHVRTEFRRRIAERDSLNARLE